MNIRTSIRRRTHMVTILLFEEYLYKKREEFYGLYRLCGGIFGVLKLFVETSAGLVITKKKQNMGQEPQIYANIITTTFYFIQKLNKILFWLVGYTCLCSIIISYVFVAWYCWYRIRFSNSICMQMATTYYYCFAWLTDMKYSLFLLIS